MSQEQIRRSGGNGEEELGGNGSSGQERREKLAAETDDILDEIDEVLEEDAETFMDAFVQKGGQ